MEKFSPIVITSKKARNHFLDIKSQYSDILKGMQDQSMRIGDFKIKKESETQMNEEKTQKSNFETERMKHEMDMKKMDIENKRRELEIKAMALSGE